MATLRLQTRLRLPGQVFQGDIKSFKRATTRPLSNAPEVCAHGQRNDLAPAGLAEGGKGQSDGGSLAAHTSAAPGNSPTTDSQTEDTREPVSMCPDNVEGGQQGGECSTLICVADGGTESGAGIPAVQEPRRAYEQRLSRSSPAVIKVHIHLVMKRTLCEIMSRL